MSTPTPPPPRKPLNLGITKAADEAIALAELVRLTENAKAAKARDDARKNAARLAAGTAGPEELARLAARMLRGAPTPRGEKK